MTQTANNEHSGATAGYTPLRDLALKYANGRTGQTVWSDEIESVCYAYLADHPEDENEPVTTEWLDQVFGQRATDQIGYGRWEKGNVELRWFAEDETFAIRESIAMYLARVKTHTNPVRRDVRLAMELFGV